MKFILTATLSEYVSVLMSISAAILYLSIWFTA